MTHLRLPFRLARREVRRRPGRTALVALLVALPVAAMALAVTLIRTDGETPREEWERRNGQADAVGYISDAELIGVPEGSRAVPVVSAYTRVKAADGTRAGVELSDLPLDNPLSEGIQHLVAGRAPTAAGEVVLSSRLADDLRLEVGDAVEWERPALTATMVGEVEATGCLSCRAALFAPGELPGPSTGGAAPDGAIFLIDLPDGLTAQQLLELHGPNGGNLQVRELQILPEFGGGDDRGEAVRWSLVVGALVLTVVGIVISAAFAVGARRQLVTIGQLSASGASPATVRTALVLQGTVTGLVGAAGGLLFAAVLLAVTQPLVERLLDQRLDGYDVRGLELAVVVLIGVASATLAALIPARTASRVPTLAALAGRRPLAPVSRRLVSWGVAAMVGGLSLLFIAVLGSQSGSSGDLWAMVAIIGGVAELLGACAISPAIVSRLEPLAHRLRGALRLGARSLARHRARTGAVVSAVGAAGALAVAAGALLLGGEAQNGVERDLPDDVIVVQAYGAEGAPTDALVDPELRASLLEALPDAEEIPLRDVRPVGAAATPDQPFWNVAPTELPATGLPVVGGGWDRALLADEALLDALRATAPIRDGLEDAGVVILTTGEGAEPAGDVVVTLPDGRTTPGVAVPFPFTPGYTTSVLVSPATADDLALEAQPFATLFESPQPLTENQRAAMEDIMYDIQDAPSTAGYQSIQWASPASGPSPFQLELILSGVALVFSLFVVGVSLALAAAESKDERDVLTIAGAPPGLLARMAAARAWLLAVLGAAMAVPVGFLPVVVFAQAQRQNTSSGAFEEGFPLVFPTRTVLLLVVVVPVTVCLVSWASSAAAQRLRPLRVSTATFE